MNKDIDNNELKEGDTIQVVDKLSMFCGEIGIITELIPFRVTVMVDNRSVSVSYRCEHIKKASSKTAYLIKLKHCYV